MTWIYDASTNGFPELRRCPKSDSRPSAVLHSKPRAPHHEYHPGSERMRKGRNRQRKSHLSRLLSSKKNSTFGKSLKDFRAKYRSDAPWHILHKLQNGFGLIVFSVSTKLSSARAGCFRSSLKPTCSRGIHLSSKAGSKPQD